MPSDSTSSINAKIEKDANPEPDQHNAGQPIRPDLDEDGKQRTKFVTDCAQQHRESLSCIEDHYDQKAVCQPFFDNYISCRREERKRRLEQNAKKSFWG
jgi:glutamine synthetase